MVVQHEQVKEFEKREAVHGQSATRMMLDILESPHGFSHEHSPETRFNKRPILSLVE